MVNKKVLALMIAAALTVQSQAGAYVSAAGTEKMSEQTEQTEAQEKGSDVEEAEQTDEAADGFGSEESGEQETSGTPVILEDLPEEPVVYKLGEKAEPLKVSVECSGKTGYTWFRSVDNEHFEEILKKADPEKDRTQEETGEKEKKQVEDGEEYTPSTEKTGTFYYKVKIRNTEDPDADQTESKAVCVQVLDENGEDENAGDADGDPTAGSDAQDGNTNGTDPDTADSENDEDAKDADENAGEDTSNPDADASDSADADEDTSDADSDAANADTDGDATGSDDKDTSDADGDVTDSDTDADTTNPDATADTSVPDSDTTVTAANHLPIRRSTIPETDTFETEGYWKADLSQIFEDPDGDELTYYEKDARAEDWEKLGSSDYLFHLTTAQETLLFTAKDAEGYGDVYAVTLKQKNQAKATKNAGSEEDFSAGEALEGSASSTASFEKAYKTTGEYLAKMAAASTPTIGSTGGEWEILGLARSGQAVDSSVYSRYKSGIVNTVKSKKGILHEKNTRNIPV